MTKIQRSSPRGPVAFLPCRHSAVHRTLTRLANQIHLHRLHTGSRWRRLDPGRQALLVLAHLRNGDTYARLAGGFGIRTSTVYRYIREALDLLAATAPDLQRAV